MKTSLSIAMIIVGVLMIFHSPTQWNFISSTGYITMLMGLLSTFTHYE